MLRQTWYLLQQSRWHYGGSRPGTSWFNPKADKVVYYTPLLMAIIGIVPLAVIMVASYPSEVANPWIENHWSISIVFLATILCNILVPAALLVCSRKDHFSPTYNLVLQTAFILMSTILTLYTIVQTRYEPYIYVACFFFLGPTLLAWGYTLYLTSRWVVFRPTSEPRLAQQLLPPMNGTVDGEIYLEGPLDGLYQQQQEAAAPRIPRLGAAHEHERYEFQRYRDESPDEMQFDETETLVAEAETASNVSASLASAVSHGPEDRDSAAINFSRPVQIWDAYITKYLAYLTATICIDLILLMHVAIGWSIWPSEPRPSLLVFVYIFDLAMSGFDVCLLTMFVVAIRHGMSIRGLGLFTMIFWALLLVWILPEIVLLSIYSGQKTERVGGLIKLMARPNAMSIATHGVLAVYATMHMHQVRTR